MVEIRRFLPLALLIVLVSALLIPQQAAHAVDYTVSCNADNATRVAELIARITDANGSADNDTISLAAGCIYTLTAVNNSDIYGDNSLPAIANNGTLTINGNGATITRDVAAPQFRFIYIPPGANLTFDSLTLSDGNSSSSGGALLNRGTLNVRNSTISNNTALGGGAIFNDSVGTINITNSTISENATSSTASGLAGGGFYNRGAITLTNSTIANNRANLGGGFSQQSGSLTLNNTLVADNTAATGADCRVVGGTITGSYNLIETACVIGGSATSTLTNTLSGDASLGTLADNGGLTFTHALLDYSVAIDSGSNSNAANAGLTTDQTGQPRFYNDTGVSDTGSGTAPIVDIGAYEHQTNSSPPTLTIDDVSLNEGNAGTTSFTFTVSLNKAAPVGGVSFDIATANNTATTADSDYTDQSFTGQTIAAGSDTYTFSVSVNGDSRAEPNETFFVNVTNVVGANVSDGQGSGTITNDDAAGITVSPTSGLITTEAGGTDTFTVVLNSQPDADVTIDLSSDDTTEGTVFPNSLTFTTSNWATAQTVTITGVNDAIDDGDVGYQIVTAAADSTDLNYDLLGAADVSVTNTDDDTQTATVTISAVPDDIVEGGTYIPAVELTTSDGQNLINAISVDVVNLNTGTAGAGDHSFTTTTITFNAGSNDGLGLGFGLVTVDDTLDENDETLIVGLSNLSGTNASIGTPDSFTLTITDDDTQTATVQFTSSGFTTTDEAGTTYDIYVSVVTSDGNPLVNPIETAVYELGTGTAGGGDYSFTNTYLTFTAGAADGSTQTATVGVISDILDENDETVELGVNLLTGTNASLGSQTTYTLTITDDDVQTATVQFSSAGFTTPDESNNDYNIDVVLTTSDGQPLLNQVVVDVSDLGTSTATLGTDYNYSAATLFFDPGTASGSTQTPNFAVSSDTLDEPDETADFGLDSLTGTNASLGAQTTHTVTITDDDAPIIPSVTVSRARLRMHAGDTRSYTVVLDAQPTGDVTITVSQPERCVVRPRTLIFTPANWDTPQTVTVRARNFPDTRCRIRHTATGGSYDGVVINAVLVRILSPAWEG